MSAPPHRRGAQRAARRPTNHPSPHTVHVQEYFRDAAQLSGIPVFSGSTPAAAVQRLSDAEREARVNAALGKVQRAQHKHLHSSQHRDGIDSIAAEFDCFLRQGFGTWDTATDTTVLVFLADAYAEAHTGKYRDAVVSGTLSKAVSQLGRAFAARSRVGPWIWQPDMPAPLGNPCSSQRVTDYITAYANEAQAEGINEVSATPMPYIVYQQFMDHLEAEFDREWALVIRGHGSRDRAVKLARDLAAFSLLWASCRRGADILRTLWHRVFTPQFGSAAEGWLQVLQRRSGPFQHYAVQARRAAPDGSVYRLASALLVRPWTTKTSKGRSPETWVAAHSCPGRYSTYSAVSNLQTLLAVATLSGWPGIREGPTFSGYSSRHPEVISSSALEKRMCDALKAAKIAPPGRAKQYTLHSMRRGRLQHEKAQGMSDEGLMRLSGIDCIKTLRRYLDAGRHV